MQQERWYNTFFENVQYNKNVNICYQKHGKAQIGEYRGWQAGDRCPTDCPEKQGSYNTPMGATQVMERKVPEIN